MGSQQSNTEAGERWCNRGQHFAPLDQFNKGKGSNGLNWRCKACVKSFNDENKNKINASRARFRKDNREHLKAQQKRLYEKHKIKILANQKTRRQSRRQQVGATQKKCYERRRDHYIAASRKRYREKRNEILQYCRTHWRKHRNRYNEYGRMRSARKRAAQGICTRQQWVDKCVYWGWRCYLCGVNLKNQSIHMEHRKPLTRGGSNWPANIAPACGPCNKAKHTKTEREYRVLVGL